MCFIIQPSVVSGFTNAFCVLTCYAGKTTLVDSLVASNGIISQRQAGKVHVHIHVHIHVHVLHVHVLTLCRLNSEVTPFSNNRNTFE